MRPDDAPPGQEPPEPLRESPPKPAESGPHPIDEPADLDAVQPPKDFHLPPQVATLFDENDTNSFYYVFTWRDGREFARSANAPWLKSPFHVMTSRLDATKVNTGPVVPQYLPGPQPREYNGEAQGGVEGGPPRFLMGGRPRMQRYRSLGTPQESPPFMHGGFREVEVLTPPGERILVGRCIAPELAEFRRTKLILAGVGGIILVLGLVGGWGLASRAIRPIRDISAAAVKISAADLSQRISTADTESELGQLAGVLNSTFARLESAFQQQQQFTSDAAHELRTPVSVVLTQTQTALNRDRSAPEYREVLESCQRAAQRMRRLIEALLELARLDAGQEPMKRARFDLSKTAQDCVELIRPLADERHVTIHCDLRPADCMGDPERLAQVITNLLTNAIHYNHEGGEVRIATQQQASSVALTVADTGQGIPSADLPHIFERFYRADKSRSAGRTGLGLAISKAIVEAHGGTLEVSSQPGAGASFTVRLPAE